MKNKCDRDKCENEGDLIAFVDIRVMDTNFTSQIALHLCEEHYQELIKDGQNIGLSIGVGDDEE